MDEHSLEEQQAALNLAALCNGRDTSEDNMRTLTNALVAGISGTGAIEIIAKGSVAKLIKSEDDANDADIAMLDLAIKMGTQAELIKQKIQAKRQGSVGSPTGEDTEMVEIKKAQSSSPAPALTPAATEEALAPRDENEPTGKRKLDGKDGFLDAENAEDRERAKRSRSR